MQPAIPLSPACCWTAHCRLLPQPRRLLPPALQGATFDAEEEEDSELQDVLPAWDRAEMDDALSFSGSEPSGEEEEEEEEEVALEVGDGRRQRGVLPCALL